MRTIRVATAAPYDVLVGSSAEVLPRLAGLLPSADRVGLIHAASVRGHTDRIAAELGAHGVRTELIEVPDAEQAKTAEVAAHCWSRLGQAGFTRSDAVVGVGGGAVTDLAGFVAATWLRGVRLVTVPTTILGMVDAAIGGKTGINIAEGKNLVGSFHEQSGVLCDLDVLATLPEGEYVTGLAEVVKCGFIADPVILERIEADPNAARRAGGALTEELVERSVRIKAEVVAGDLTESGSGSASGVSRGIGREVLNYGHTLGHAIERREAYRWRHGAAISVGMVFVAELARAAGRLDAATADRHRRILEALGLPTTYDGPLDELVAAMRLDKKTRGDTLRFVVLDGLAKPAMLEGPAPELIETAYAVVSGR